MAVPGLTRKRIYLSTVFLGNAWKTDPQQDSLAYSMTLGVRVPDYEVQNKLWFNDHYEGAYLFRDTVIIELISPKTPAATWQVSYKWQGGSNAVIPVPNLSGNGGTILIPFENKNNPGIRGKIRFTVSPWS